MRGTHATIDALLKIQKENNLTPEKIASVSVFTSSFVMRLSNRKPDTAVGAQASTEFSSAIALKYGKIDSEELIVKSLRDPEVISIAEKITLSKDGAVQQYLENNPTHFGAARVVVTTVDGANYEQWSPIPLGDEEMPLGWDTLKSKFKGLIEEAPFAAKADVLVDHILRLDEAQNVDMLLTPDKQ